MTNLIHIEKLNQETLTAERPAPENSHRLLFIRSGNGSLHLVYKSFTIQPNRLFFIPAGAAETTITWTGTGWLVTFEDWLLRAFFQLQPQEKLLPLFIQNKKPYADLPSTRAVAVHSVLLMLWQELKYEESIKIAQTYLHALLLHLADAYRQAHQIPASWVNYEPVERLLGLIGENFKTERLPAFYADRLAMPVRKLNGLAKKATGKLVQELITDQVLAEAERMLVAGQLSIKEIAYELEFADMAQFSHFMRKHTGRSPRDFRRNTLPDK